MKPNTEKANLQALAQQASSGKDGAAALKAMRELGANADNLSLQILKVRAYRPMLRAVPQAVHPLFEAYQQCLDMHTAPEKTALWWAMMASGEWRKDVIDMFAGLSDWTVLCNYGYENRATAHIQKFDTHNNPVHKRCRDQAELVWEMIVELACEHGWHMLPHEVAMPLKTAILCHNNPTMRERGMKEIKEIWDAVYKAECVEQEGLHPRHAFVKDTLSTMYWTKAFLNREDRCEFRRDNWKPTKRLQELFYRRFSYLRHTKTVNEDAHAYTQT